MILKFQPIKNSDLEFLYTLLESREKIDNISHKKLPTFKEHTSFVKSKPYKKWYVVLNGKTKIGTVYLSKINEIGIHLLPKFKKNIFYQQILEYIMTKYPKTRLLVNINYKNNSLKRLYKKNGFKLIQYTFERMDD